MDSDDEDTPHPNTIQSRCRLVKLKNRSDLNNHVVERSGDEKDGRVPVVVLSSGQQLSVPAASCEPLDDAPDVRIPHRTAGGDAAALRALLEGAFRANLSDEQAGIDLSDFVDLIVSMLVLPPVDLRQVAATGASSSNDYGPCHPSNTLKMSRQNWWISADQPETGGSGEWVEYCLGEHRAVVDFFMMTIPPLPSGPLSVRVFKLEARNEPEAPWERASEDLMTLDVPRQQWWALVPPIEARYVRIVCLVNAAAHARVGFRPPDSIGFFEAGFATRPRAKAVATR